MTKTLKAIQKKYGIRIIVLLLSVLFLCTFIARKEGYHMDEILAFQLADAEYNPWIVPTQPVGRLAKFMREYIDGDSFGETISNVLFIVKDTVTNRGNSILAGYKADVYEAPVWINRQMFQDYVQCDTSDAFNFASVYFNVKDDNHPPLHFMLLHLMTSLFQGEINVWHGCIINLAAMAAVLWLLGLIGDIVFQSKKSSVACMILYGFSMGIVATTVWIRMYALLTLWTVWGLYLHLRKMTGAGQDSFCRQKKNGKEKWLGSAGIFTLTLFSFWTQYFGLFFILPLALVTVILLARQKRINELWAYVRTMLTAAAVGICVYPFAIEDVLFSGRGAEALSKWQNGLLEYLERLKAFGTVLAENTAAFPGLFVLLLLIPAVLLLVKRLRVCGTKKEHRQKASEERETSENTGVVWLWAVPAAAYFLLAAKMSPYFLDRYVMAVFPMAALLFVWLWEQAGQAYLKKEVCGAVCIGLAVFVSVIQAVSMGGEHPYLYQGYRAQVQIAEDYAEYPLVCLYDGYGFYENVVEMERYQETMLVKRSELCQMDEERTAVTKDGYVALIKYPGEHNGAAQLEEVMAVFGGSHAELLYAGGAFGDVLYLVR